MRAVSTNVPGNPRTCGDLRTVLRFPRQLQIGWIAVVVGVVVALLGQGGQASAAPPSGFYVADSPIPVANSCYGGQIGRSDDPTAIHSTIPLGTADVFGNGPYDLFVVPNRLFPFREFDDVGTPRYGRPLTTSGDRIHEILRGPNGGIWGIRTAGSKVRVCRLNKQELVFEKTAESEELSVASGLGSGIAGYVDPGGRLHVYATIADGTTYRPAGDHHAATYMPYDGAGFWRGGIPRRILVRICFDSLDLRRVEYVGRAGEGPGEFLFGVRAMTVVNTGLQQGASLITSEKLGVLRCFAIDEQTGALGPPKFVNDQRSVALRHPAINPSAKNIADPATGLSNLIVGEGGRLWFYRFSGDCANNGSPIYATPAKPVLAEDAPITLGNLPVISAGDLDGDGLVDLIAGNNAGDLLYLRNIGKPTRPEFDNPVRIAVGDRPLDVKAGYRGSIQGPGEAMWGYTCPTFCDWNGDGQLDVILNSILADYMFLEGRSTDEGPRFCAPTPLYCDGLQLHLAWRCQPAITDWGARDRLCMVALDEANLLRQFWRIDDQNVERGELLLMKNGLPITANADEAAGQTGRAKLVAHDWDGDGDIDLLIGTSRGLSFPASEHTFLPSSYGIARSASVLLLRNVGTNAEPVFDYVKQVEYDGVRIQLGIHSCSPAPVDLGRGVVDLLVGEEAGTIHYYPGELLSVSGPGE